ncbi:hypothetical protein GQX74_002495 [Glossina fuscipes]|nr:hypothetical protein GQX74_002495 [Glossina fuscipes]
MFLEDKLSEYVAVTVAAEEDGKATLFACVPNVNADPETRFTCFVTSVICPGMFSCAELTLKGHTFVEHGTVGGGAGIKELVVYFRIEAEVPFSPVPTKAITKPRAIVPKPAYRKALANVLGPRKTPKRSSSSEEPPRDASCIYIK